MNITELMKDEIRSYETREWSGVLGGTRVSMYAKPLTPQDFTKVSRKYPNFMQNPEPAAMAFIIALKALDDQGNNLFIQGQDRIIRELDVNMVGDIFAALFGDDLSEEALDLEGAEKNSETTSSDSLASASVAS